MGDSTQSQEYSGTASLDWDWEETDPKRSGSSGDISKLFRHDATKNPGVLAVDAPPPNATIMAREVIQNSWDAARELKSASERGGKEAPPFEIGFDYRDLEGDEKSRIVDHLDLNSLSSRASDKNRQDLGLRQNDCLKDLSSTESLPVIYIREQGTTGMYGPWEGAESKMFKALVSVGYTQKEEGAGGSYGYGKAGLIRASAIRSLVAYTCFREKDEDPGVTRRLLGMTYWGPHYHDGQSYTGFARLADEEREPFKNERADRIAEKLGMSTRSPENPEDLGTTFLLVEPTVQPDELLKAIERSWWPAIDDEDFFVSVISSDGERKHPRPKKDPKLLPFIRAREIATSRQDNSPEDEEKYEFQSIEEGGETYSEPGNLGVVADLEGWSYADQTVSGAHGEKPIEHRSLVALMRNPKMVVEYYDAGQTPPYVRGAFVAGDSVNEVLRKTEPKGHDAWRTTSDGDEVSSRAANVADTILNRIYTNVNRFRKSLKPPKPPADDIRLPHFDRFVRRVMSGGNVGVNPPTGVTRPVKIHLDQNLEYVGDDEVRLTGSARLSLSEHYDGDEGDVEVSVSYRFVEDERLGASCPINVEAPDGFQVQEGSTNKFEGTLVRDEKAIFKFETDAYSSTWTARLIVNADVVEKNDEGQNP